MAGRLGALAARAISHAGAGCSGPHSLAPALTALHGARILGSPLARGQWFHPDAGKSAPSAPWVSTGEWRSFAASARENAADEPKSEASQLNYRRETRGDEASAGRAPSAPPSGTWISTLLPPAAQPYAKLMRLDAPIGTWLLLWPGYWSIAMASTGSAPDVQLLALFGVGSVLLRGAGCTINDFWDRDVDRLVERTRSRPIASGQVSPAAALAFLGAQLLAGLGVLVQLNDFSVLVGAASLGLVFTYPLMKRITFWPQAFLGLTFNWGALLGWAAVHGSLDWSVVGPLYASGVAWTLVYDTIYAHQDKVDDSKVGVYSTALRFGEQTPLWLTGFSGLTVAGLSAAGHAAGLSWPFYAATAGAGAHLLWQVHTVDLGSPPDCSRKFRSNSWVGALVFSGIVLGKAVA